ncbi:MAG: thioredoxin family protein [Planctomycetes bacterium]|nr:thioredoxin family protein [Planctomycetota bacterium]
MLLAALASFLCSYPQDPPAPITAALRPGDHAKEHLGWSPKGAKVELSMDLGTLHGRFDLGHPGAPQIAVRLTRSEGAAHFDRIWVDTNRDEKVDEREVLTAEVSERRGKWWSSADVTVPVSWRDDGGDAKTRPYPIALWFVEDPQEPDAAPALRWSRRGWHEGEVTIDGKPAFVLITDMQMDGRFDQRDAWALGRDKKALLRASARSMESHFWLDGVAYRMTALDPDGASITFERFDPGFTEAEEKARNDTLAVDRKAPRAAAPLAFEADFEAAMKTAKAQGKRVFVDFQTTWCGPCRAMEQHVYTADAVVKAAAETVCIKLDGDEQRDLVKRYEVAAYPTMLLLDADGKVLRRLVGYQHVTDMVKFLREDG